MKKKCLMKIYAIIAVTMAISSLLSPVMAKQAASDRQLEELKFELFVLDWDTISVDAGHAIAEAVKEIGIEMVVKELDDSVFYPKVYGGGYYDKYGGVVVDVLREYQSYEMSEGFVPSPTHVYFRTHSSQDYDNGGNHGFTHNDELDGALEKSMNATTTAELKSALNDVQEICANTLPYMPLFVSDDSHIIRKEWLGYLQLPGGIFTSFNPWTIINMSATPVDSDFTMAYPSPPSYLNPFDYTDERSGWLATCIYDSLVAYDDELATIPWLAESFIKSADGLTVNYTLRTGVKWHDGEDLTPADVKYTIERTMNETNSPRFGNVEYVKNCTIDGNVITVKFKEPSAFAVEDVGYLKILPKHLFELHTDLNDFNGFDAALHVGSGPFNYTSGVEGGPFVLEKNDDYWYVGGTGMPELTDGSLPTGSYPKIEKITIKVDDTSANRILGMQNNEYDSERYEADVSVIEKLGTADYNNLKLVNTPSQWDYYMVFNQAIKPFDDLIVRQAIAYSIDLPAIAQQARGDYATVTYSVVPECFFPDYNNPNIEKYALNVDKANKLLDDAGYLDVDDDDIREMPGAEAPAAPGFEVVVFFASMIVIVPLVRRRKK